MKAKRISWLLLAAALGLTAQAAHSASITVDAGGNCTLGEAITSANNDSAAGNGCADGSSADTITLQADVSLTTPLPPIASAITIEGGGKTINGNNSLSVGSLLTVASGGNLTIKGLTMQNGNTTDGGGIYNNGGTVTVENSTISNNSAANAGGGIYSQGGTVSLKNSTVASNSASGNVGGGLYVLGAAGALATVTIDRSTVSSNTALTGGGGIAATNSDGAGLNVTLNNSTVSSNTAFLGGGFFIWSANTNVTLNNTTVSSNQKGGIHIGNSAAVMLKSSIVSGNNNDNQGNEVKNNVDSGTVTANSYNVFGHSGETGAQAFLGFTPGVNDRTATSDGTTPKALNLILNTTLANNGGPTQTHALVVDSPAIDRDATCSTGLSTDQRGYTRQINFKCDAGAVEYSPSFSLASGNGRDLPASTWLMTAPPCQPAGTPSISAQYGPGIPGGAAAYGISWIGYAWDAAATSPQYVPLGSGNPLRLGNGSWLYSSNSGAVSMAGGGTATTTEDCTAYGLAGQCFAINLIIPPAGASRWNFVGHPFPYAVSWADVRVATHDGSAWTQRTPSQAAADSIMAKEMWRWSGNAYESKDDYVAGGMLGTLLPQEAVWVRSLAGSSAFLFGEIKLLIPAR